MHIRGAEGRICVSILYGPPIVNRPCRPDSSSRICKDLTHRENINEKHVLTTRVFYISPLKIMLMHIANTNLINSMGALISKLDFLMSACGT